MSDEFRRAPRRDVKHQIDIVDLMIQKTIGNVVNISENGIMILSLLPINTDAIYQCELIFPKDYPFRSPFIVGLQEMWVEPVASGQVSYVGFRIIDIETADRLRVIEWVNESF